MLCQGKKTPRYKISKISGQNSEQCICDGNSNSIEGTFCSGSARRKELLWLQSGFLDFFLVASSSYYYYHYHFKPNDFLCMCMAKSAAGFRWVFSLMLNTFYIFV